MAGPEVTAALKLRDDMSPALRTAAGSVGGFSSFVQQAGATMAGFLGAQVVNAVGNFINGSIAARAESDKLAAQTGAAIKSTGGVAHVTAQQVDQLANAIKRYSGFDDEAIANGENLLLTFTGVRNEAGKGNDVFTQSTKIMVDMARALGTDAAGSAIQLGKALNDPLKGITALTRVGVTFSDEQKKQIKNFMAHNDIMGAQKVILKELTKEFGGSAMAFGNSSAGMLDKMKNAVGDAQEALGGVFLTVISSVAPYITQIANATNDWFTANQPLVDQVVGFVSSGLKPLFSLIGEGVGIIGSILGSFKSFNDHLDASATAGDRVVGILGSVVDAFGVAPEVVERVGAALGGIVDEYQKGLAPVFNDLVGFFTGSVIPAFYQLRDGLLALEPRFSTMLEKVRPFLAILLMLYEKHLAQTINALKILLPAAINVLVGAFGLVIDVVSGVAQTFTDLWTLLDDLFHGRWGKLWDDAVSLLMNMKGNFDRIMGDVAGIVLGFFGDIIDGVVGSKGSVPQLVGRVVGWFESLPGSILAALSGAPGALSSIGSDMVKAMTGGLDFGALLGRVKSFITDLPGNILSAIGDAGSWLKDTGAQLIEGLTKGMSFGPFLGALTAGFETARDLLYNVLILIGDLIHGRWGKIWNDAVAIFSGVVSGIAKVGANLLRGVLGVFDTLKGRVGDAVAGIVAQVVGAFGSLVNAVGLGPMLGVLGAGVDTIRTLVGNVVAFVDDLIHGRWSKLWGDAVAIFSGVVDGVLATGRAFIGAVGSIFGSIVSAMPDQVQQVLAFFIALPGQILSALGDAASWLTSTGAALVQGLVDGMGLQPVLDAIGLGMDTVRGAVRDALTFLDDLIHGRWSALWDDAVTIFSGVVRGMLAAGQNLLAAVVGIFRSMGTNVWKAAQSLVALVLGTIGDMIEQLVGPKGAIPTMAARVISFFRALPGNILKTLVGVDKLLWDTGIDLVQGLMNGIGYWWGRLIAFIKQKLSWLPQPVKDALGIASPSRVMEEVGKNYVLGLQQGITKTWPGISRTVGGLRVPLPGGALGFAGAGAGGGGVTEYHLHVDKGAFIDGVGIDLLFKEFTDRLRANPGT